MKARRRVLDAHDSTPTIRTNLPWVRSNAVGVAGKIAQCVGVRLPNTMRHVDVEKEVADPSP